MSSERANSRKIAFLAAWMFVLSLGLVWVVVALNGDENADSVIISRGLGCELPRDDPPPTVADGLAAPEAAKTPRSPRAQDRDPSDDTATIDDEAADAGFEPDVRTVGRARPLEPHRLEDARRGRHHRRDTVPTGAVRRRDRLGDGELHARAVQSAAHARGRRAWDLHLPQPGSALDDRSGQRREQRRVRGRAERAPVVVRGVLGRQSVGLGELRDGRVLERPTNDYYDWGAIWVR